MADKFVELTTLEGEQIHISITHNFEFRRSDHPENPDGSLIIRRKPMTEAEVETIEVRESIDHIRNMLKAARIPLLQNPNA